MISSCIWAQKPWHRKPTLIWKKKKRLWIPPACWTFRASFSSTDQLSGIAGCQDRSNGQTFLWLGSPSSIVCPAGWNADSCYHSVLLSTEALNREEEAVLGEVVMPGSRVGREGWGLSLFKTEPWIFSFRCLHYGKFHSFLIVLGSRFLNGGSLQSLVASCRGKHVRSGQHVLLHLRPRGLLPFNTVVLSLGAGSKGKSASAFRKLLQIAKLGPGLQEVSHFWGRTFRKTVKAETAQQRVQRVVGGTTDNVGRKFLPCKQKQQEVISLRGTDGKGRWILCLL